MTERYITHHVTDHCAIQGPESQVLAQVSRYGRRNVAKMYREIDALRKAIRAEGAAAIQEAWDAVEEQIDFAYRQPEAVKQSLTTGDLVSREAAITAIGDATLHGITADGGAYILVRSDYRDALRALPAHHIGEVNKMAAPTTGCDYCVEGKQADGETDCPCQAAAPAVKVKPLVWKPYGDVGSVAQPKVTSLQYAIFPSGQRGGEFAMRCSECRAFTYHPSIEAAQIAAQKHHEARILAALEGGEA